MTPRSLLGSKVNNLSAIGGDYEDLPSLEIKLCYETLSDEGAPVEHPSLISIVAMVVKLAIGTRKRKSAAVSQRWKTYEVWL